VRQIEATLAERNPSLAAHPLPLPAGAGAIDRWITRAILPLATTVATLRADGPQDAKKLIAQMAQSDDARDAGLRTVWQMQARHAFPYDACFERAHDSAMAFARDNPAMITEHFGSADTYADLYAETNTDAMMALCAQTVGAATAGATVAALRHNDPTRFAHSFPGAFLRGLITSYVAALGPMTPADLASSLHTELSAAIVG
jgi:hypothetical protein